MTRSTIVTRLRSMLRSLKHTLLNATYTLRTAFARPPDRQQLRRAADALTIHTVFTIRLQSTGADRRALLHTIRSLQRQAWPHWILLIEPAPSPPAAHTDALERSTADPRVHITQTNDSPQPGFTLHLPAGAALAPDALLHFARAVAASPNAQLLYADHDSIDMFGLRRRPQRKPRWSPHRLRSRNYVGAAFAIRSDAEHRIRCIDPNAAPYGVLLHASRLLPHDAVVAVHEVLFHLPERGIDGDPQVARNTLTSFLASSAADGASTASTTIEMLETHPVVLRAVYPTPPDCRVSVIIPTKNRADLLHTTVEGVLQHTDFPNLEVIIVDNGSDEPQALHMLHELQSNPKICIRTHDGAFNFSAMCNIGARASSGTVLCFLNNDVRITQPGWLRELTGLALQPDVGAAGPLLFYPDGRVQHLGIRVDDGLPRLIGDGMPAAALRNTLTLRERREVAALTGACLVMTRARFDRINGFDERLAVAYNDVDICLHLRSIGLSVVWTPFAELVHELSASRGFTRTDADRARHAREWEHLRTKWANSLNSY